MEALKKGLDLSRSKLTLSLDDLMKVVKCDDCGKYLTVWQVLKAAGINPDDPLRPKGSRGIYAPQVAAV